MSETSGAGSGGRWAVLVRPSANRVYAAGAGRDDLGATPARPRRLRVLDPLCGRGTTSHQALRYGCDADGPDVDGRDLDALSPRRARGRARIWRPRAGPLGWHP